MGVIGCQLLEELSHDISARNWLALPVEGLRSRCTGPTFNTTGSPEDIGSLSRIEG
jgi:hypothetical protein